jgi:hypothetical protein
MQDPAVGRTRAQRAFGPDKNQQPKGVSPQKRPSKKAPPAKKKVAAKKTVKKAEDIRNVNVGMFSGPRPSYQRYNVSERASDLLNRSKRNMDAR